MLYEVITTLARIGGDEFNILIENVERIEDVKAVIKTLLDVFNKPFTYKNKEFSQISASIGITRITSYNVCYTKLLRIALKYDELEATGYLNNIRVYDLDRLETLATQYHIKSAIFTEKIPQKELQEIIERLNNVGIHEIKQVKLLGSSHEKLEDISIEDLLARHPKDLDLETIAQFIQEKSILITGAGGSIGSEIAMQCQKFGATSLTLVDNSRITSYNVCYTKLLRV